LRVREWSTQYVQLAEISVEVAQSVIAPDTDGNPLLPAWFLVEVGRDLQKQSHDDKFGGADAKGRNGKRKDRQRHGKSRLNRFKIETARGHAQSTSVIAAMQQCRKQRAD